MVFSDKAGPVCRSPGRRSARRPSAPSPAPVSPAIAATAARRARGASSSARPGYARRPHQDRSPTTPLGAIHRAGRRRAAEGPMRTALPAGRHRHRSRAGGRQRASRQRLPRGAWASARRQPQAATRPGPSSPASWRRRSEIRGWQRPASAWPSQVCRPLPAASARPTLRAARSDRPGGFRSRAAAVSRTQRSFDTVAVRSPFALHLVDVFPRHVAERDPRRDLCGDALAAFRGRRVASAPTTSRAASRAFRASPSDTVGIATDRELFLDPKHSEFEPPEPAARRRHQQVEAATVRQLVFLVAGFRGSHRCVGQRHRLRSLPIGKAPKKAPRFHRLLAHKGEQP